MEFGTLSRPSSSSVCHTCGPAFLFVWPSLFADPLWVPLASVDAPVSHLHHQTSLTRNTKKTEDKGPAREHEVFEQSHPSRAVALLLCFGYGCVRRGLGSTSSTGGPDTTSKQQVDDDDTRLRTNLQQSRPVFFSSLCLALPRYHHQLEHPRRIGHSIPRAPSSAVTVQYSCLRKDGSTHWAAKKRSLSVRFFSHLLLPPFHKQCTCHCTYPAFLSLPLSLLCRLAHCLLSVVLW